MEIQGGNRREGSGRSLKGEKNKENVENFISQTNNIDNKERGVNRDYKGDDQGEEKRGYEIDGIT